MHMWVCVPRAPVASLGSWSHRALPPLYQTDAPHPALCCEPGKPGTEEMKGEGCVAVRNHGLGQLVDQMPVWPHGNKGHGRTVHEAPALHKAVTCLLCPHQRQGPLPRATAHAQGLKSRPSSASC